MDACFRSAPVRTSADRIFDPQIEHGRCRSRRSAYASGARAAEQVTEGHPPEQRRPAKPSVLRPVGDHVISLPEGRAVGVRVVRGVLVSMGSGQDHTGSTNAAEHSGRRREPNPPAPAVPPTASIPIQPSTVAKVADDATMRAPTTFAAVFRPTEPDHG